MLIVFITYWKLYKNLPEKENLRKISVNGYGFVVTGAGPETTGSRSFQSQFPVLCS